MSSFALVIISCQLYGKLIMSVFKIFFCKLSSKFYSCTHCKYESECGWCSFTTNSSRNCLISAGVMVSINIELNNSKRNMQLTSLNMLYYPLEPKARTFHWFYNYKIQTKGIHYLEFIISSRKCVIHASIRILKYM